MSRLGNWQLFPQHEDAQGYLNPGDLLAPSSLVVVMCLGPRQGKATFREGCGAKILASRKPD